MIWNNKEWVARTPIITFLLLEGANVSQIMRMVTERTAAGQSLIAWCVVLLAIILWWNFYRVVTPDQKIAKYVTLVSIIMKLGVISSVVYFRYFHVT